MNANRYGQSYIIEFVPWGNAVKVSAVDPVTGEEASIVGDPNATQEALTQLAIQKLEYIRDKKGS